MDLITRARVHAATHPESRDLVEELIVPWICLSS